MADERSPLLDELGERLRTLRARRGMTRRDLSGAARVSERYLANLEGGKANPSLIVLDQIARGLECPAAELLGDVTTTSPEWLLIRDLLGDRGEVELRKARLGIAAAIGTEDAARREGRRIALIGLRGAGKSTLGRRLADDLGLAFVELSSEVERATGHSIAEIHDLYGHGAYRRYERRALEALLMQRAEFVMAAPGGLVSAPATFSMLLNGCVTVWLKADPQDHMTRVTTQGDMRPMAGNKEAMEDLCRILSGREAFYSKADATVNTSAGSIDEAFCELKAAVHACQGGT